MDISIKSSKNRKLEDIDQKLDTLAYYIEYLDARVSFVGLISENTIAELQGRLLATQEALTNVVATSEQRNKINKSLDKIEQDLKHVFALKAKQLEKEFNEQVDTIKEKYGRK